MIAKKIQIVTDAAPPQINGVVTTLTGLTEQLRIRGYIVDLIEPQRFRTIALPWYKEIRLAWDLINVGKMIDEFSPDFLHIATEGPIGLAARIYCSFKKIPFTTSYHTNFPEFVNAFTGLPASIFYPMIRWFHKPATAILVTTESMKTHLTAKGFNNLVVWNRAVDTSLFSDKYRDPHLYSYPRPILLNVGRVSIEKNIEAFLQIETTGTKVIIGDGPIRKELELRYPEVKFLGTKQGEELAAYYASADVFVFPSRTDTFGLVIIEAMATGTPVAAYPITSPIDIVENGVNGQLSTNLLTAIEEARFVSRTSTRLSTISNYSWSAFTNTFVDTLSPIHR